MIDLLAARAIMRSKVFIHRWLIISHRYNLANLNNFDLMIALAAKKLFMRLKFKKALLANFDLMIVLVTN
jgi:hypothetical protein